MKLIFEATGLPVAVGDDVLLDAPIRRFTVSHFRPPHKPASEGYVTGWVDGDRNQVRQFYVSVIGAKWIEREDRHE